MLFYANEKAAYQKKSETTHVLIRNPHSMLVGLLFDSAFMTSNREISQINRNRTPIKLFQDTKNNLKSYI